MSYILIVGAKSDIAKEIAIEYAKQGYHLYLAARNCDQLATFASDIKIRTEQTVKVVELDILNTESHHQFYENLEHKPVGVVVAVGYLGDQQLAQSAFKEAKHIMNTNYCGVVSLLNIIANDFEQKQSGFIIGISSVAGDRGRQSNYLYGSAKAGLTAYLSGLRNRLHQSKVQVLTVKPGFVATRMTAGMDLPKKLTASATMVATDIYRAQQKGKNVIYTKSIWRYIMLIIKWIPEWLFKKMNI